MRLFKKKLEDIDTIVINRYTYAEWRREFEENSHFMWTNAQLPYSMGLFVYSILNSISENTNVDSIRSIKLLTIDNRYREWEKEHSQEDVSNYMIDDNKIDEVMADNNMLHDYHMVILPVLIILEASDNLNTNITLTEDIWSKIDNYICSIFGENSFVFHYLPKLNDIYHEQETLFEAARAYFESGVRVKIDKYLVQKRDTFDPQLLQIGVPIIINGSIRSGLINKDEFLSQMNNIRNSPENLILEKSILESCGIENVPSFSDSDAFHDLCNYLGEQAVVSPCLESVYSIPDFLEENARTVNKYNKKHNLRKAEKKA